MKLSLTSRSNSKRCFKAYECQGIDNISSEKPIAGLVLRHWFLFGFLHFLEFICFAGPFLGIICACFHLQKYRIAKYMPDQREGTTVFHSSMSWSTYPFTLAAKSFSILIPCNLFSVDLFFARDFRGKSWLKTS